MSGRPLTLGERRVRLGASLVDRTVRYDTAPGAVAGIRVAAAALIDEVEALPAEDGETMRLKRLAQIATEEAAMWGVKAATRPT